MIEEKIKAIKVDLECAIDWLKNMDSTDALCAIENIEAALKELEEE